ncbi:bifunctional protein-serine/threonine kinase/phosphatase [Maricurvus nonylphenolicus]|uniref:protein kinase domain-containing protein n=1 Tax=Maricurvus nonylphenolicus TaxID=1008307 RepID=UPI0036F3D0A3
MTELQLDIARFSEAGIKPINEDSVGCYQPAESYPLMSKGITLAVADGVSTAEAGREASATTIERFIEEYYQTPDTWSVSRSGEKILSTVNLRLFRKSHEFTSETKGYLCTFSAVVVKSRTLHYFHVGDSRVYLWRDGELKQLTTDHVATIADNHTCLARAMGMDSRLHVDYGHTPLEEGDRLLLTSDGVHDFISPESLASLMGEDKSAEEIVASLKQEAINAKTDDNLSAIVADVKVLPGENLDDYSAQLTRLPFPPDLAVGMKLDGYRIVKEIFASSRSQLYLVEDEATGEQLAMKTPSRNFEDDVSYIDRFIQEEWIGKRIHSPHVVKVIDQLRPRTALYYLMEFVEGEGLDDWIARHQHPSPKQSISIVKQIAEGLKAFHSNEAIHQDLKPGNIIIANDGRVIILDFGSVYVAGLAELQRPLKHEGALGTASYSDPLYLMGRNPGIQGDVYALATLAYEIFTGHLPYGNGVEECRTALDYDRLRYQSATKYNPIIPVWFDSALEKGVSFELQERYHSIDELIQDLTQPNPEFLRTDPVVEKNTSSLLFWKLLSGFWFLSFFLVLYLFSRME